MPRSYKGQHISTRPRLKAPASLSPGARKVFEHVVASVHVDHFSAVDLPLLSEYASACEQAALAGREIAKAGAVVGGKPNPWLIPQEKAVRAMTALSARLRVAPHSRFDRLVAGANSRPQVPDASDDDDPYWPSEMNAELTMDDRRSETKIEQSILKKYGNASRDENRVLEAVEDLQDDVTRGLNELRADVSGVHGIVDELLHEILLMRQDLANARAEKATQRDDGG